LLLLGRYLGGTVHLSGEGTAFHVCVNFIISICKSMMGEHNGTKKIRMKQIRIAKTKNKIRNVLAHPVEQLIIGYTQPLDYSFEKSRALRDGRCDGISDTIPYLQMALWL
jgi:hypothetical protein